MHTQKECPNCGGKSSRTEVSIKTVSVPIVLPGSSEVVFHNKPTQVISFQCRECGTWFS